MANEPPTTLEDAEAMIQNAVYAATAMLEELEYAGRLRSNGHHARQAVARAARDELRGRWIEIEQPVTPDDAPRFVPGRN